MSVEQVTLSEVRKVTPAILTKWKEEKGSWRSSAILIYIIALIEAYTLPLKQDVDLRAYTVFLILMISFLVFNNLRSIKNEKIRTSIKYKAEFYTAIGGILIVWDLLTTKTNTLPLPFFPSVIQILQVIGEDYQTLLISTAHSLRLIVLGFTIGTIIGMIIGILIGWYRKWHYWVFPLVKLMGVIPTTAWIPIVMYIFPSSFYAQIFLIVICVCFPVAFMTCSGVENLPKSYFEAARTLGGDEKFLIIKVAIPGAMPSIFTGIYTATGISFATLVVSEMIGAKAGLGWYISWAKSWSNYAKVYASIVIMAVIFSLVMAVIYKIRDSVLVWQRGLLK